MKDSAFFALSPLSVSFFFFFLMSVGDVVGCWFHNKIVNSVSGGESVHLLGRVEVVPLPTHQWLV